MTLNVFTLDLATIEEEEANQAQVYAADCEAPYCFPSLMAAARALQIL